MKVTNELVDVSLQNLVEAVLYGRATSCVDPTTSYELNTNLLPESCSILVGTSGGVRRDMNIRSSQYDIFICLEVWNALRTSCCRHQLLLAIHDDDSTCVGVQQCVQTSWDNKNRNSLGYDRDEKSKWDESSSIFACVFATSGLM